MFSMGLRSGDCTGQFITVIFSSLNHCLTNLEVWQVALSCWNIHPLGIDNMSRVGISAFSRMLMYPFPSNLPSTFKYPHTFPTYATPHHDPPSSMLNNGLDTIFIKFFTNHSSHVQSTITPMD